MKKKVIIITIIVFVLMFPLIKSTLGEIMIPDKVLLVGHQVDNTTIDFSKEIRDKKKINQFENIFKEVKFLQDVKLKEENYPDMITNIRHKNGTSTHWFKIWVNEEESIVLKSNLGKPSIGRLTKSQVDTLESIVTD